MKELIGEDLFDQIAKSDAICIATNCSIVNDDGEASNPMGGGCAGAAAQRWPELPIVYGALLACAPHVPVILGYVNRNDVEDYIYIDQVPAQGVDWCAIVAYPTMHSIAEPASLDLVERSAMLLSEMADTHEWEHVVVARPGCGIGGLDWETEVKPAIKDILDDRFTLIHKEFKAGPFTKKWKKLVN